MENAPATLDASGASLNDIISALRDLKVKELGDKQLEDIVTDVLENYKVNEWEDILNAGPKALKAIGGFLALLSGDVGQFTQKKDKSIPPDLRTNLERCSKLGLETFNRAHENMANLEAAITEIIATEGVMDKVLDTIRSIRPALRSKSSEGIRTISEELTRQLGDLKQRTQRCTEGSKSVVDGFAEWSSQVEKILVAYTRVEEKKGKKLESLERDLSSLMKGDKGPAMVSAVKMGIEGIFKKERPSFEKLCKSMMDVGELTAQVMDREKVMELLGSFLSNLEWITQNLELLDSFFCELHQQIEDLSQWELEQFAKDVKAELNGKKPPKLYQNAYRIKCLYMYAGWKASVYLDASEKYIIPGTELIKRSRGGPGLSDGDNKELQEYCESSMRDIRAFARGQLPATQTNAQLVKRIENGCLTSWKKG